MKWRAAIICSFFHSSSDMPVKSRLRGREPITCLSPSPPAPRGVNGSAGGGREACGCRAAYSFICCAAITAYDIPAWLHRTRSIGAAAGGGLWGGTGFGSGRAAPKHARPMRAIAWADSRSHLLSAELCRLTTGGEGGGA